MLNTTNEARFGGNGSNDHDHALADADVDEDTDTPLPPAFYTLSARVAELEAEAEAETAEKEAARVAALPPRERALHALSISLGEEAASAVLTLLREERKTERKRLAKRALTGAIALAPVALPLLGLLAPKKKPTLKERAIRAFTSLLS